MLKSAAPSGAASDSFCPPVRGHIALCICAASVGGGAATAKRQGTELRIDSRFCGTEPNRGPSDCRAKDRGGYDSIAANLPPHSKGKGSAAQSGRQNGVVSQ